MRSALGSIQKKGDDYWLVAVTVGTDPKTGNQKRISKRVRGSRRTAEIELTRMLVENGLSPDDSPRLTFREYVESIFLPNMEKEARKHRDGGDGRYKQTTVDSYRNKLNKHILPYIGDRNLADLNASDARYVQSQAPTEAMAKEARKVMSAVFKEAVYDQMMERNPVSNARPPRPTRYEPDILELDEIAAYLQHFRGDRAEMLVLLALGGAYRRGEIAALDVEDIDLKTGKVRVSKSYVPTSQGPELGDPKNRKARTNYLPPVILERLREILPSSGPVYASPRGGRVSPDALSHMYQRKLATLPDGITRVPLKNLRHSSLTLVYDATGSMEQAKGHAGHGSQAVTRRHYVRAHDQQEIATVTAMDELLREALDYLPDSDAN